MGLITTTVETNEHPLTNPYRFFWAVTRPHRLWAIGAILIVVIASVSIQSTSYFYKLIVEAVERGDLESALWWGLLFPVTTFSVQLLFRCSGFVGARWTTSAAKEGHVILFDHLTKHSHTYFSNRFAGSITSKVRNVTGAIEEIIPDFLWSQVSSLVSFVTAFVLIMTVDMYAASAFIGLLVVLLVVNSLMSGEKARLSKVSAALSTKLQGRVVDNFTNIAAVRQYARRDFEVAEHQIIVEEKRAAGLKNWMYTERMLLINSVLLFVFTFAMVWRLISVWGQGQISAGDFVLVLAIVSNLAGTLLFIGRAFNAMARTLGEMREGLEDIYQPFEIVDAPQATNLSVEGGQIEWRNVTFQFGDNTVFSDFSLSIPAGQRVGLVGSSGAGKSTFVSLLLRQHELPAGQILIDGQDIAAVTQDSLRAAIAIVPQEPMLFHRSIKENILYGREGATENDLFAAARRAQVHDFVRTLPEGYDTLVGERGGKALWWTKATGGDCARHA